MFSFYKTEMLAKCEVENCPHRTRFRIHFMGSSPTPKCRKCFKKMMKNYK